MFVAQKEHAKAIQHACAIQDILEIIANIGTAAENSILILLMCAVEMEHAYHQIIVIAVLIISDQNAKHGNAFLFCLTTQIMFVQRKDIAIHLTTANAFLVILNQTAHLSDATK